MNIKNKKNNRILELFVYDMTRKKTFEQHTSLVYRRPNTPRIIKIICKWIGLLFGFQPSPQWKNWKTGYSRGEVNNQFQIKGHFCMPHYMLSLLAWRNVYFFAKKVIAFGNLWFSSPHFLPPWLSKNIQKTPSLE